MARSQEGVLIDLDDLMGLADALGQEEEDIVLPPRRDEPTDDEEEEVYVPPARDRTHKSSRPPPPAPQQRQQAAAPPSPPARQSHLDPGPGAYRVSPRRGITMASGTISSDSSVATNQGNTFSVPPPSLALPSLAEAEPVSSYLVEATPINAALAPELVPEALSSTPQPPEPTLNETLPLGQSPPVQQQGPGRRKRLALFLALGAVVVAAIIGVAVWAATRSTGAPAPAPGPSTSSIWSEDRLETTCSTLRETFDNCVNYTGLGESDCETCVVDSWGVDPSLIKECSPVVEETCRSLSASCPLCSGCEPEFLDYFECRSQCALAGVDGCTFSPAPRPTPSPTPSEVKCPQEKLLFNKCVDYSGTELSNCERCIVDQWPVKPSNVTSCTQIDDETCSALSACASCAGCEQELLTYVECASNCDLPSADECTGGVPTAAPTNACSNFEKDFAACTTDPCIACRNDLIGDGAASCAVIENRTCNIAGFCPDCAPCVSLLVAWNNCLLEGDCPEIACEPAGPTQAPAPGGPTQAPAPGGPTQAPAPGGPTQAPTPYPCPDEFDVYWSCVAAFTGGSSSECRTCRNDHFNVTINTCQDSQIRTCALDDACPMCGPCEDQQVALVNCLNGDGCESFNCSSSESP
jgi:hypothetical protein